MGQSRCLPSTATAYIVKLSGLSSHSIETLPTALLPMAGKLIVSVILSFIPSPSVSTLYVNTQPVATVLSCTVHDIFSVHWPPAETSQTSYS